MATPDDEQRDERASEAGDEPADAAEPIEPDESDTAAPEEPVAEEPDVAAAEAVDTPATVAEPADAAEVEVDATRRPFRRRHTWSQRALLSLNIVVILTCFVGAGGLIIGRHYGNSIPKVALPSDAIPDPTSAPLVVGTTVPLAPGETLPPGVTSTLSTAPDETFPRADPQAQNFLITGADNNACVDPNSPYAPAFGDRSSMGERSDTVMIMRVDPSTNRAAILSFPRDLWVTIAGSNRKSRINSAYVKNDPTKLIYTLALNFEIPVDHFIQIDFCAFKTIVDSIDGGVGVPFTYPARDTHTGLYVPDPGCYYFNGDSALAYVRSRYYQYYDENGKWKSDPVSDLGRISRQQDFIRRVLTAALNQGLFNPSIARGLISAATNNVVVDDRLTLAKMLEFVGVLRDIQPGGIATYQIEAVGKTIAGNAVLEPRINGDNMQAILRIFKGEAPLAEPPPQVFDTTTTSTTTTLAPATTTSSPSGTGGSGSSSSTSSSTTTTSSTTTAPTTTVAPADTPAAPTENIQGIVPPRDVTCP